MEHFRELSGKSRPRYLNSREAARILGVDVSTIKRWTDSGKLACIRTAGGHRKFLMRHLADFARSDGKAARSVSVLPVATPIDREVSYRVQRGDYDFLIPVLEQAALNGHYSRVQDVLQGLYLARHPLYEIYDHLVTPVLHRIGDLWASGRITITEEHLASQAIRDCLVRLQEIVSSTPTPSGTALCMNLSEELHDIAIKMVQHVLEDRGFQVLFSGQRTPAVKLETIFESFRPGRVYISSTYVDRTQAAQAELNRVLHACQRYEARVFVGGAGFDLLDAHRPQVIKRLVTFRDVAQS